jgi:predicted ATPase/DNA-binding SARP family transcriptional activator
LCDPVAIHTLIAVEPWERAGLGIQLLGAFSVWVAGDQVPDSAWRLRRSKSLIKLLALAPERRLHREQLLELLWPGEDPAANSLHQVLYTARRALGPEAGERLVLRDDVVALAGADLWIDVDAFERAAADARRQRTIEAYRAACDLHVGELLPEDRYEDWTTARRESLRETYLALFVEQAELQSQAGDALGAIATLQRAIVDAPLHELAHRALMRLFAADGRRQQALTQYQQLRDALRRELEADPDPETRALYREILAAQHEEPEAEPSQPRPAASTAARPLASQLPRQLTSFVGRERELAELERLLGHAPLLTLTGPGGCGKTRLSLELAARRAEDFEAGVRVVELASISDPALVVDQTATALGVFTRSEGDPVEGLARQVGDQQLLLVLDNCEHLIDACAQLADRLLRECPGLRVLATSRERLRIEGEVAWRVPSLSLPESHPDVTELERSEAVRLFCLRAAEAAPGFALDAENVAHVAEICRRLDGMPLALELAAARAGALSPAQIAERLVDALSLLRAGSRAGLTRQQTLRATLVWSHDLLSEPERVLYRRLGVFAGSFGVDAVEGICAGGEVASADVLDLLVRLVDKSLVQVEPGARGHRYRLLETVRQDARERIAQAGERDPLEAAHREWYLALVEAGDRDVDPDVAPEWPAERLEPEHDNLRAALASAIRHDPPVALRLANAVWWFWLARGYFVEGLRWFEAALAAAPDETLTRARALVAAAGIVVRMHRVPVERLLTFTTEALDIARRAGDRHAEARAFERVGMTSAMGGFDWRQADDAFAQGLAIAEEIGDDAVIVAIKQAQGVVAGCRGDNARARELLEESLALLADIPAERGPLFWAARISPVVVPAGPGGQLRMFFEETFLLLRAVHSRAGAAYVLCNIAEAWRSDGDYISARGALERALALFDELGDDQGRSAALNALGNLARSAGDFDGGREWFAQALELRRAAHDRREIALTLAGMGLLELYAGDRDTAGERLGEAMGIFERTEDGPGLQLMPLNVGGFELDHGDPQRAAELLARCEAIGREQGLVRNRGWASAELAEAALALGDPQRARRALDVALALFEHLAEPRGTRYARELEERLGALTHAD